VRWPCTRRAAPAPAFHSVCHAENKLRKPIILNPLEDPSAADELAKIANVLAQEPSVLKAAPKKGAGPTPDEELLASKDDLDLLNDSISA
jgi:hypothetical protein